MADVQTETWTMYVSNTSVDHCNYTSRPGMDQTRETGSQHQPIIARIFIYVKNVDGAVKV
jgi:hypothetical protein